MYFINTNKKKNIIYILHMTYLIFGKNCPRGLSCSITYSSIFTYKLFFFLNEGSERSRQEEYM